jgi:hypothetical protein
MAPHGAITKRRSMQNSMYHLLIDRACSHLGAQLGQLGLELLIDEDECGYATSGVAMAGGDEIVDFRV